jgi:hypothetical protein
MTSPARGTTKYDTINPNNIKNAENMKINIELNFPVYPLLDTPRHPPLLLSLALILPLGVVHSYVGFLDKLYRRITVEIPLVPDTVANFPNKEC